MLNRRPPALWILSVTLQVGLLLTSEARLTALMILDLQPGTLTTLTSGPWHDNFPAWSPKGDLIVFTSDRDGDWELYTIRPDGRRLTRLTRSPGNDAHAAWSSDGQWMAFASARGGFKDRCRSEKGVVRALETSS